ncbi:mitochondrial 54S ribosomal protein bL34m RNJ42_05057 [Nakaseomyces bracarensis]|uniref:mitochondrial 54S ribosomal protein bL34m n=1 Tax=Nakaseomyces bracarensis TaxID=273131 RepID=UPI0038719900
MSRTLFNTMLKFNRFQLNPINQKIQSRALSMISAPFGVTRSTMNQSLELSRVNNHTVASSPIGSAFGLFMPSFIINPFQRRWKSRGNTYQPSTLKRKRKFGFLARMMSKRTAKIIKRRKEKGRWYLTH